MNNINRLAGLALIAIGALIAIHTIIEPVYYTSTAASPFSPLWQSIDVLMALAVVLGAIYSCIRKRAVGGSADEPVSREYLAANVQFYGFMVIGILFFWNWFNLLNPGFTGVGNDSVSLVWGIIDASLPVLCITLGLHQIQGNR